jgi:hypothetical protein
MTAPTLARPRRGRVRVSPAVSQYVGSALVVERIGFEHVCDIRVYIDLVADSAE